MELHTRCICVCVELKCYVNLALPDLTGEGTNSGRGERGLFQSGLLCPCKLNFMYVCVCTPVNLYYTFIFMICIHLYLLFSSVCVCVRACVHLWKERESNHEQTVCGTSGSNLRENELGGLFRSVTSSMPGKLNFISTY